MSRARQRWDAFWRAIPRRASLVLLALAIPTAAALAALVDPAAGRLRLRVDASADRLLPVDAPERQLYDRVQKLFGSDRALVVVLAAPDVFSREGLLAVARISARLEALPEVEQVLSLATASHVHSVDDDIAVEPFLEDIPADAEGLAALRAAGTRSTPGAWSRGTGARRRSSRGSGSSRTKRSSAAARTAPWRQPRATRSGASPAPRSTSPVAPTSRPRARASCSERA
jgi:hypothetical protein